MKIVIEYDVEKKRAAIIVDDRSAQIWKDCDLTMSKIIPDSDPDTPTHEHSLVLYGTRTV